MILAKEKEMLDVYDDHFNHIGVSSREETHQKGYWHYTFHCWVLVPTNKGLQILLQKRHPRKETNPGKLSVSAAGHILAGETAMDGLREVEEEIGLTVSSDEIQRMGEYHVTSRSPSLYNREISLLFYTIQPISLLSLTPQPSEVVGLYLISTEDFYRLLHENKPSVAASSFQTTDSGKKVAKETVITVQDFADDSLEYYRYISAYFQHSSGFQSQKLGTSNNNRREK